MHPVLFSLLGAVAFLGVLALLAVGSAAVLILIDTLSMPRTDPGIIAELESRMYSGGSS
jgi:hypothetical protein